jgi:hypothetical protein
MDIMTRVFSRCPDCGGKKVVNSRFDTCFRFTPVGPRIDPMTMSVAPGGTVERLCFAIPSTLCHECHKLFIDPGLLEILDVVGWRLVFAIESDQVIQERAQEEQP